MEWRTEGRAPPLFVTTILGWPAPSVAGLKKNWALPEAAPGSTVSIPPPARNGTVLLVIFPLWSRVCRQCAQRNSLNLCVALRALGEPSAGDPPSGIRWTAGASREGISQFPCWQVRAAKAPPLNKSPLTSRDRVALLNSSRSPDATGATRAKCAQETISSAVATAESFSGGARHSGVALAI